jgi:hypothetical protein
VLVSDAGVLVAGTGVLVGGSGVFVGVAEVDVDAGPVTVMPVVETATWLKTPASLFWRPARTAFVTWTSALPALDADHVTEKSGQTPEQNPMRNAATCSVPDDTDESRTVLQALLTCTSSGEATAGLKVMVTSKALS